MTLKHFVTWKVTLQELEEIIKQLREAPIISIPIDKEVELILKRKEAKP